MRVGRAWASIAFGCLVSLLGSGVEASTEYNPVRDRPVSIGPEASRILVAFKATMANAEVRTIQRRVHSQPARFVQARTTASDAVQLGLRAGIETRATRQLTPSMHVLYLRNTLYGADVAASLAALRADPHVSFADVDQRRYPHAVPDDPLYLPSTEAAGQWYLMTPSPSGDASATDAVTAWNLTTGSTGTVIADVDTGVRFDHPDLLRAGFGGRLLPGYDFVSGDQSATTGALLGTYLTANDGDGWDPDPSDPGDWIDATDQSNAMFPASKCPIADSSWHGTRVMGLLGALTDNGVGIAGMTWKPYLLPVRSLGKCGGYDSDIITGMQWAAGMPVSGVPDNPYPADIVNLSLGGSGACPTAYASAIGTLTQLGVLIVASAGNGGDAVDAPGNCAGVLAVAGLRNVGTKVGYSSLGAQVGVAAPAGNCINSTGLCLKPIDTTSNTGLQGPAQSTYTNETNPNLGTSFSSPIVAGIAALMRAVNPNLTPPQLIARIEASAVAFPQPAGLPVCPATAQSNGVSTGECACPNDGSECGAGMVNALNAVTAALRPIAAVVVPAAASGSVTLDASGSAASCSRGIASFAWHASGGAVISGAAATAQVSVTSSGTAGTVTLTVTDSSGAIDTAVIAVAANGSVTRAATTPTSAGSSGACPTALTVTAVPPTVGVGFSPASVGEQVTSTLTLTLNNLNGFDLTQSGVSAALPANLTIPASSATTAAPATTCGGALATLTTAAASVTLSAANIPAHGSCVITLPVQSSVAGSYGVTVADNALTTGPAGSNSAAAAAALTVTAPSKSGGGAWDWWDTLFVVGVLLAGRRAKLKPPNGR